MLRRGFGVLSLLLLTQLATAAAPAPHELPALATEPTNEVTPLGDVLARLEVRAATVEERARSLASFHDEHVEPLVAMLETNSSGDAASIRRAAVALVREGRSEGIDPRLLTAVLLVENPWLDPGVRSPVGAVGLMQVMPFHAGHWGCPGEDLTHPETNICHGTRILAEALRRTRDLDTALLRYNGCRYGTNTPDCHDYPQWVYGRAGPAWMAEIDPSGAADPAVRATTPTS
jgi:soluble lytic murein transglycosylase-like protein